MAKRTRVTEQERAAIIAAFDTGKSCNQIAREFNRANRTISLIARDVGHKFSQINAQRAREIKAVYDDERRAALKLKHIEAVERLIGQMFAPAKLMKIGGKDNEYTEHAIDEPTFQDKRDISYAISNLMRIVNQMDRDEVELHDGGIVDELLNHIQREAEHYDAGAATGETGVEHPAS